MFELLGGGGDRRHVWGGVESMQPRWELFRREGSVLSGFGEGSIFLPISRQFPCAESEGGEDCSALTDGVVAIEVSGGEPLAHL